MSPSAGLSLFEFVAEALEGSGVHVPPQHINFDPGDFGGAGQRKLEFLDANYYICLVVLPTVQRWPRCSIK